MDRNGSLDSNWVSDIETNWSLYQDAQKNLSTLNTLKAPKKCDIVTLWQEFSIKQRSIGSNFCRLSSIVAKTDRNFCKNTTFIYISSNSSMQWKNLANKRNSPGSRADDIRWVRPWRICGAWRTSGVHQVKSRLQQISNPHSRQICYASVNKSTTAAVGKFNEQIFLERFPQNMNQSFKICLSLAVCIP